MMLRFGFLGVLVVMVMALPAGIIGTIARLADKLRRR